MDDELDGGPAAGEWDSAELADRAVLSESPEGRAIAADFIETFGAFMSASVRPVLRDVASAGGEPQLLVNGLAQLLREVADTVELPIGAERTSARPSDGPTPPDPGQ